MSYYKILGVSEDASDSDITKAYRKLIKSLHPDTNPGDPAAEELFKEHYREVVSAYNVLGDASKRKAYDEARGQQQRPEPERQPPPRRSPTRDPNDHPAPHRDRTVPQDRPRRASRQASEQPDHWQRQRSEPGLDEPPGRGAHGDGAANSSGGRRRQRTWLLRLAVWGFFLAVWGSVGIAVLLGVRWLVYDQSPDEALEWAVEAVTTGNIGGTEASHDGTGWRLGEPHEAEWGIIHAQAWVEAVPADNLLEVRCVTDFERGVDRGLFTVLHPASLRIALSRATTMRVLSRFSGEQHLSESQWLVGESVLWLDPEQTDRFLARFDGADKLFLRIEYSEFSDSEQSLTFDLADLSALSIVKSACD